MSVTCVEMRGITRRFGGVCAVEAASLELRAGEVVGLLGHNGAGKSTLMGVLSGVFPAEAGEILLDGTPTRIDSPRAARGLGIEALYQDLALADNLGAAANLFLGRERRTRLGLLDESAMERAARDVIRSVNPYFSDFASPVQRLSGGERQSVAIARALHFRARVLIMDEPTAALGPEETRSVADQVRRLRDAGLAIVLVSHDLHDVMQLADRVVVMRAGRTIASRDTALVSRDELLELIIAGERGGDSPA